MNRHDVIDLILALAAVAAVIVSMNALNYSKEANKLATEANEIAYKNNLPSFKFMQVQKQDTVTGEKIGELSIYNVGGRAEDVRILLYTVAAISYLNYQKSSYINIRDYCEQPVDVPPGSNTLIWSSQIRKGYDRFEKVRTDFNAASSAALNEATISIKPIVTISYSDFMKRNYLTEYYDFANSNKLNTEEGKRIIEEANSNESLANRLGISLSLVYANGQSIYKMWSSNLRK